MSSPAQAPWRPRQDRTQETAQAIFLWKSLGYSLKETARGMKMSETRVKHHWYRGKKAEAVLSKIPCWGLK